MTRLPRILSLAALALFLSVPAQARPVRPAPPPNAAVQARAAVMDRFTARMGRLDALMGPNRAARSRSADAEH